MSLLDDVSIVVTPNGYKAGRLYGVLPVPTEGSEEITNYNLNGNFSDTSALHTWISAFGGGYAPSTGVNDGSIRITSNGGIRLNGVYMGVVVGKLYKVSVLASTNTGTALLNCSGDLTNFTLKQTVTTTPTTFDFYVTYSSYISFFANLTSNILTLDDISVKEWTASDMDVTRATAATRVDENGLVNYAEIIGDSILTGNNSNFDTGIGSWVTLDGATLTHSTDKLQVTLTTGQSGAKIDTNSLISGGQAGKTFKVRARIWQGTTTATALKIYIGGAQENITISSTPTYFEFELTATNTGMLTIYRAGGTGGVGTYFIDDVTVKEIDRNNVPRIDYTGGGCPHILAEPQRTNLITYSEDLTNSFYSRVGMQVVTESTIKSPDGTSYGYTIVPTSITQTHYLNYDYPQITVPTGIEVTYSIFVKPNGYNFMQIAASTGFGSKFQNFELTGDGVLGIGDVNNKTIEKIGDWYRISATETTINVNPRFLLITSPTALPSRNSSFAGNGTDGVLGWGVQVEQGSYPTSYIPTSGSSVTRNKDVFTRDGIGSLINSTEGVLFLEVAALSLTSTLEMLSLSDGTYNNVVLFRYYDTSSNDIQVQVKVAGSVQASMLFTLTDATSFNKIAIKYKENDFALWVNGVEVNTDSSGTTFTSSTLNKLSFDRGDGSNPLFSKVRQLQVYDTALTDMQLIQLTGTAGTDFYESYSEMTESLTYTIQ